MSPITHVLAGWTLAESCTKVRRERLWICLAGLAPDLDGIGILVDLKNEMFSPYISQYYAKYHHFLLHGLFGALLIVAISRAAGVRRGLALLLVFLSFHLHLACDLIGGRGPAVYDIWAINYLGPFTRSWTVSWAHQWPLNGWPNFLITLLLLAWTVARAIRHGASPLSLLSQKWDATVVATFRRWSSRCRASVPRSREQF